MSENTGTTPLCAHCGRPIISTTLRHGNSGELYHAECTRQQPDWATEIERLTRQIEDAQGSCFLLLKAIEEGDPMRELQIRVRDLERILNPKPVSPMRTGGSDE